MTYQIRKTRNQPYWHIYQNRVLIYSHLNSKAAAIEYVHYLETRDQIREARANMRSNVIEGNPWAIPTYNGPTLTLIRGAS